MAWADDRNHRSIVGCLRSKMTMKMIQPNCRVQFTAADVDFVLSVLGRGMGTADCLVKLLADEHSRDLILDDPALFKPTMAINTAEAPAWAPVPPGLTEFKGMPR